MNVCILGSGTWGTALGLVLRSAGHKVTIWSKFEDEIAGITATHTHRNLPGVVIDSALNFTSDLSGAVSGADFVFSAVPSPFVRETARSVKELLTPDQIIISVSKGIEAGTLFTMSEIIDDEIRSACPIVALSGPSHAEEVSRRLPTLIVSASKDPEVAKEVQELFHGTCIRPYTNYDITGVELCGALKNIIALACGISRGLGYGDNTLAALITRGNSEITKLGLKMGCAPETFSGLAGIGDLIVTSTSNHSRNNRAGQYIGQGLSSEEAVKKVGMVVEGMNAIPAALELSRKYEVEMPLVNAVNDVVNNHIPPKDVVFALFSRQLKGEIDMEYDLY